MPSPIHQHQGTSLSLVVLGGLVILAAAAASIFVPEAALALLVSVTVFGLSSRYALRGVAVEDRPFLTKALCLAVALRLGALAVVNTMGLIPQGDAAVYHAKGEEVALLIRGGNWAYAVSLIENYLEAPNWGYQLFVVLQYSLLGSNQLIGQGINCVIGALCLVPVYLLARLITESRGAHRWAVGIMAVFPSVIIWNTQLLKDTLVVFLELLVIVFLLRVAIGHPRARDSGWLAVLVMLLGLMRLYIPPIMLGVWLGALFILAWQKRRGSEFRPVLMTSLMLIALIPALWLLMGPYVRAYVTTEFFTWHEYTLGGDTDYPAIRSVQSPGDLIRLLPLTAAYFLLGPFPWMIRTRMESMALPELLLWYPVFACALIGFHRALRGWAGVFLVFWVLALSLFYAAFSANMGSAYRMRMQVIPLYVVLAAPVLGSMTSTKKSPGAGPTAGMSRRTGNQG